MLINCPFCRDRLDLNDELGAQQHLSEHFRIMREAEAEEQKEHDPQGGAEMLAPWTKADFTKNYPPSEPPQSER